MLLKTRLYSILIITIYGLLLSLSAYADVEIRPLNTGDEDSLILSGEIKKSDIEVLKMNLPKHKSIWLNSLGGDVSAAMSIGQLLRRYDITAFLDSGHYCVSACVLVLAGSTFRMIKGKVGIHRPYLPQDKATTEEEQKKIYRTIKTEILNYLEFMNVNSILYDDMFRISPRKVKYLSKDELERYGLTGTDPYFEEAAAAREAGELEISKQELYKRKNQQDECMRFFYVSKVEMVNCRMASIYGISIDEYVKRTELAKRECGDREADRIKWRDCEEKIMRKQ